MKGRAGDMAAWYTARTMSWSAKAVIAAGVLAVLLVAAVPVALLVGLILMLAGHVVGGLALFGASILVAIAAIGIAGVSGARYLRKLVGQVGQVGQADQESHRVVQLGRGEYRYE